MSFSFNGSGSDYSSSYQGVEAIAPENTGIGWIAQTRINNIVGRANQRLINALKVDGVPLTLWTKTQTGYPCTCCKPEGVTSGLLAAAVQNTPTTNNFYTDPEATNLPSPTEQKYKVIRMRGEDLVNDAQEDIWSNLINPVNKNITPEVNETFPLNEVQVNLNQNQDDDLITPNVNSLEGQEEFGDFELDSFFAGGDSGAVFGGDKTACGVCFTSGWTQGYTLVNGKRIVLDASGEVPFSLQGADLISSTYPSSFKLPLNNQGVYWQIELPVFSQQWVNVRARNNLKAAPNVLIEYTDSIETPTWQTLTLDVLNSTSNVGTRVWYIRARRDPSANQIDVIFTHLELMVITSDPIPSQTPNFTYNTDFNQYDAIVNTQFDIAPTIAMIPRESVFSDNKYGLFWKVTNVTPQMTSGQQVFGFTVDARLVQRHEMLYNLHTLYVEAPCYVAVAGASGTELQEYNSTKPNQLNEIASTASNFEKLEQVQGGYPAVNFEEQSYGQQVDNIGVDDAQPLDFTQVPDNEIIIPLEANLGNILTDDLLTNFTYEPNIASPVVITQYPDNVYSSVSFTVSGTNYPAGSFVQVGVSTNVEVQPVFWQNATVSGTTWTANITIENPDLYYIWATSILMQINQTVIGPITCL